MKIAGTKVEDASEPLTIMITKSDVRSGSTKKATSCAAAKALCRQEHCDEARVHFSRAYIRRGEKWIRFSVPPSLRSEIVAFDRGGEFAPGEYRLTPLQPIARLGARKHPADTRGKRSHKNHGKRKRPYHIATGVRARMMADWE